MKQSIHLLLIIFLSILMSCSQSTPNKLLYIDEIKPSTEPLLFAKDFITKESISEFGSVFNAKGTEFFFAIDSAGKASIKHTSIKDGKWTEPQTIIFHEEDSFNDPFLSPDEKRLYYISDKPRSDTDSIKDYDIWYSEKRGSNWSDPINAGSEINSDADEYYISFNDAGTMYFATNKDNVDERRRDFDIYKSNHVNGEFQTAKRMDDSINTKSYKADVFISPDESYIIFCATRESGFGRGDLYISFKKDDGTWTKSVNMGSKINTKGHELCPFVTKDNKYLFYTSNQDIYWVSAEVIDEIKGNRL